MNDHDRLVRNFRKTFGLSDEAAEVAARGRGGGPSSRPVSESLVGLRPDPANIPHVVAAIKEIASGLCREGLAEDKALREAAVKVMLRVPDDRTADWVARVAQRFWPGIYSDLGSSCSTVSETRKPGSSGRRSGFATGD